MALLGGEFCGEMYPLWGGFASKLAERLADQAFPETQVSDERSPSRDGKQEPLLYQVSPAKRIHQAQRCEVFYLAEDLRHLGLGWHPIRVGLELLKMERRSERSEK